MLTGRPLYGMIPLALKSAVPHARVVELADSLDSGSSVRYGRAGSSPASRTKSDTDFDTMGISLVSDFLRHGAAGFA